MRTQEGRVGGRTRSTVSKAQFCSGTRNHHLEFRKTRVFGGEIAIAEMHVLAPESRQSTTGLEGFALILRGGVTQTWQTFGGQREIRWL